MTTFDTTWSILKAIQADDFHMLSEALTGDSTVADIIYQQLTHPSTNVDLPTNRRQIYRAGYDDYKDKAGLFYTPQFNTAHQYSGWRDFPSPRRIDRFKLPVNLDDKTVLQVKPNVRDYQNQYFKDLDESEDVQRVADANNLSFEEAAKEMDGIWSPTMMGGGAQDPELLRNAGYDFMTWNEYPSSRIYPTTLESALGAITWGANHQSRGRKEKYGPTLDYFDDLARQIEGIIGLDRESTPYKIGGAWGKHKSLPQHGIWHIGDEDTTPEHEYHVMDAKPKNKWRLSHMKSDYYDYNRALGAGLKRV